ncbi:MAG TPA: hypothetical protein VLY85_01255, partial [Thermoplasmata archaeon]|nr:hypothetical protein [Thermoplasmata archaeon]
PPGGRAYFTIGTGIGGLSTWQIGQTWTIQLASYESSALSLPDNLTVSVVSNGLLIFRASVPGLSPTFPPVFTNYGTTPGTPTAGKQFSINVQVQGVNTVRWVNATLSDIPGFTSASVAMSANGTGEWSYVVASGKTTGAVSGVVYYAVVSATDSQFLTSQVVVPVVFH